MKDQNEFMTKQEAPGKLPPALITVGNSQLSNKTEIHNILTYKNV